MRADTLTDGVWLAKDAEVAQTLATQQKQFQKELRLGNVARAYELIQRAIQLSLQDCSF